MLNIELSLELKKELLSILKISPRITREELFFELLNKATQEDNAPFTMEEVRQGLLNLHIDGEIKTIPKFESENAYFTLDQSLSYFTKQNLDNTKLSCH